MFHSRAIRYYIRLAVLSLVLVVLIIALGIICPGLLNTIPAVLLTTGFALAAFISLLIFFNGFFSDNKKSVFMTLIALGVKMLFSFVLALLFFLVFKNGYPFIARREHFGYAVEVANLETLINGIQLF